MNAYSPVDTSLCVSGSDAPQKTDSHPRESVFFLALRESKNRSERGTRFTQYSRGLWRDDFTIFRKIFQKPYFVMTPSRDAVFRGKTPWGEGSGDGYLPWG